MSHRSTGKGGFLARLIPFKPCKKHSNKISEHESQHGLDPDELIFEASHPPTTETDSALNDDLDDIVAKIDDVIAAQDKDKKHLVESLLLAKSKGGAHDPPGDYSQCDTATTISDGMIALSDDTTIEVIDLSFDLEAATKFTDIDKHDLGRHHSSMNVRSCKSGMCETCQNKEGVKFVKSKMFGKRSSTRAMF